MTFHTTPRALNAVHVPVRVLIVPGLHDSGPGHWQTWLQSQYQGAVRVVQADWHRPDLLRWSDRIAQTLARHDPRTQWIAVGHSFGCLALAHHLGLMRAVQRQWVRPADSGHLSVRGGIASAFMVAPASPDKFDIRNLLPTEGLGLPGLLVGSDTDPWMAADEAQRWAQTWGLRFDNAGDAGHINVESGHGPWPLARLQVDQMIRHLQRQRRLELAHPMEFHHAI